jgi:hypothetical protein
VADVRQLDPSPRSFRTRFGGLFLFLPYLAAIPFDDIITNAGLPGSAMIPAPHAMRSLLALKLFATERKSHVMSMVFDEDTQIGAGYQSAKSRHIFRDFIDATATVRYRRARSKCASKSAHIIPCFSLLALIEWICLCLGSTVNA